MKSWIIGAVVVVVLLGGGWIYLTRAPSAPSEDIVSEDIVKEMPGGVLATVDEGEEVSQELEQETYRISQEDSIVTFSIDEVLRGEDFTVVGVTDQVAGDIVVNGEDLSQVEFGPVRINARTLKTDSTQRDGAIARAILRSEQAEHEFITLDGITVEAGNSDELDGGTPVTISGNLTVAGVMRPVVFEGSLQHGGEGQIEGQAETVVAYKDFGLVIPEVPFVASVEDDVTLTIDFVAERV